MTDALAVFAIHRRLSQEAAKALLCEDLSGAACSDRFGAYNWIERRGYCWAHLKRDFQAMAERFGSEWYGCRLVASARRVLAAWRMHRKGKIGRRERDERLADERRRIHRLLVAAKERAPAAKTQRECAEPLRTEERMWTFVDIDAMDPTNNLAERSVRRGVLWRKKSFGTDSEAGSRFVAHILTVVTTMNLQRRPIFAFLVQALEVAIRESEPPSLCPTTSTKTLNEAPAGRRQGRRMAWCGMRSITLTGDDGTIPVVLDLARFLHLPSDLGLLPGVVTSARR
ncbi:MAG: transposase [Caldilineae bacterium]|nr:transposase [Caldilineae bacterium]